MAIWLLAIISSFESMGTIIVEIDDEDFDWISARNPVNRRNLRLPVDGVDAKPILDIIRRMTHDLHRAQCRGTWMIVADDEIVGLCGYKHPPAEGVVEIGYGVAESRRCRGHATRAVAAMIDVARSDPAISAILAETSVTNPASESVLAKHGFTRVGHRLDPDDGPMALWRLDPRGGGG
jgi:RimJ/RimL family protein N-acetyltransferase